MEGLSGDEIIVADSAYRIKKPGPPRTATRPRKLVPSIGCFAPAGDLQDDHQPSVVMDIVDHAVGSNPNAPGPLLSPKLTYSCWPRVVCQSLDGRCQPGLDFWRQAPQLSLGGWSQLNSVRHSLPF